jgi:CRISPR system Cascade subunit CasE
MPDPVLSRVMVEVPSGPLERATPEYLRHQAVASLFRQVPEARPIHRLLHEEGSTATLMVLSRSAPTCTREIVPGTWVRSLASKAYRPSLIAGLQLDFDLLANATTVVTGDDGRKRRTDVWDAVFGGSERESSDRTGVYASWLARQLSNAATLQRLEIAARSFIRIRKSGRGPSVAFVRTRLLGSLRVEDPRRLHELIVHGVGRARAFGCGLLCLLPHGHLMRRR